MNEIILWALILFGKDFRKRRKQLEKNILLSLPTTICGRERERETKNKSHTLYSFRKKREKSKSSKKIVMIVPEFIRFHVSPIIQFSWSLFLFAVKFNRKHFFSACIFFTADFHNSIYQRNLVRMNISTMCVWSLISTFFMSRP